MPNQASADPPTWRFPLCRQPCHCWAPLTGPLASPKLKLTSSGGKMVGEMVVVRDSGDPPHRFLALSGYNPPALQVQDSLRVTSV